ncbi:hypothetical protein [uncultured Roseobacter sp.]|uniref:hypothetical protein n=1 Tax=uncultured Roseobacter sp. TaxID=114847 RepID=UPI00262A957B|nr:hypothetical protein [uncultured Roseobacter sp.]
MVGAYSHSFILGPHTPLSLPLQRLLARNPDRLLEVGAEFPAAKMHREVLSSILKSPAHELATPAAYQSYVDTVLEYDETERVVYNYDAFIGSRKNALMDGFFYPSMETKIALLRQLTLGQEIALFLCIRHYTAFLEVELQNNELFGELVTSYPDQIDFSWTHFIWRLQKAWPEALLVILDADTLPQNWAPVVSLITGHPETHLFQNIGKYPASCLADAGRRPYLKSMKSKAPGSITEWTDRTSAFFQEFGTQDAILRKVIASPWKPDQVQHSKEKYDADMVALRSLENVVLARDLNWEAQ